MNLSSVPYTTWLSTIVSMKKGASQEARVEKLQPRQSVKLLYLFEVLLAPLTRTPKIAETKTLKHRRNPKVTCNVLKLATICLSRFAFLLLPSGSPLN